MQFYIVSNCFDGKVRFELSLSTALRELVFPDEKCLLIPQLARILHHKALSVKIRRENYLFFTYRIQIKRMHMQAKQKRTFNASGQIRGQKSDHFFYDPEVPREASDTPRKPRKWRVPGWISLNFTDHEWFLKF
ncbi:MAG: hypothetical protein LIP11_03730 [Clostridiales bacterium]|nr:hypothetical protein [Clostridiales bacterium]